MDTVLKKLQSIFKETLLSAHPLHPGHESTNDVYLVKTANSQYIVKVVKEPNKQSSFWRGLNLLFGVTHENSIRNQEKLSEHINQFGIIPTPKIYKADGGVNNPLKRPYVILEVLPGHPIPSDGETSDALMKDSDVAAQLGTLLGNLHRQTFSFFGCLDKKGHALKEFPTKLANTIQTLANTPKALKDPLVQKMLPYYYQEARNIEPPKSASLIMLDLWPSQFLEIKGQLCALVDIESYCIGPIELELCLLELWLKKRSKFKEAYFVVNTNWPDYEQTREIYRYFLYLLYDCPEQGLDSCIDSKGKFAQGDRIKSRIASPRPRLGPIANPYNPYTEEDE